MKRTCSSRKGSSRARWLVGSLVAVAAVGTFASSASAHVTISTLGEIDDGFAKLGVSVPTERDDAGTVKLELQMPTDHPLPFVSVQPKPGWDVATTMRSLDTPIEVFGASYSEVVDTVTWTATGDTQIAPGQFDLFWLSVGPIPDGVTRVEFPALQTYSDGEVVRWIEPTPEGGEEPEHPAPVLEVAEGTDAPVATDDDDSSDSGDSNVLPIVALAVGAVALALGLANRFQRSKQ